MPNNILSSLSESGNLKARYSKADQRYSQGIGAAYTSGQDSKPAQKEAAREAMILVELAYEVLTDPEEYTQWLYPNYYQVTQTQNKWDEAHPEVPPGFKPQFQSFVDRNCDLIQKEIDTLREQGIATPAENLTFIAPCKTFVVEILRRKAPSSKLLKAYEH